MPTLEPIIILRSKSDYGLYTYGYSSSFSSYGLFTKGVAQDNSTYNLYAQGYATAVSSYGGYLVGYLTTFSTYGLYAFGNIAANSSYSLFTHGEGTTASFYNFYLIGYQSSNSSYGAYTVGYATSNSSYGSYLVGYLSTNSHYNLYAFGDLYSGSFYGMYVLPTAATNSSYAMYSFGYLSATPSTYDLYTFGINFGASSYGMYVNAFDIGSFLMDRRLIKNIILAKIGQSVGVYRNTFTSDMGEEVTNRTTALLETTTAHVQLMDEGHDLVKKGLYFVGDAEAWFPYDSAIQNEDQVAMTLDGGTRQRKYIWNVVEMDIGIAEEQVKYKKVLLKRAMEPDQAYDGAAAPARAPIFMNRDLIKNVILAKIGQPISVYRNTILSDMGGETSGRTTALVGTYQSHLNILKENHELVRRGLYFTGDAEAWFPYDADIEVEDQIQMSTDMGDQLIKHCWNVVKLDVGNAENEVKYKKVMLKRAIEGDQ